MLGRRRTLGWRAAQLTRIHTKKDQDKEETCLELLASLSAHN